MGYQEFTKKELMPHNVNAVEETGAKILDTACAECYRAFARDYKQWGGNPPYSVFHISHYVEKLIREKRIAFTKPLPQKIAFHDACHMSRVSHVYEPPRQALKFIRDLKVLEILPHHEDALCSGAGGGFPAVFPEQAAGVAQRRLDAAEDTGATTLVTTCPHAEMHFAGVARSRNMTLSIVDLAEMLANALSDPLRITCPPAWIRSASRVRTDQRGAARRPRDASSDIETPGVRAPLGRPGPSRFRSFQRPHRSGPCR